MHEHARSLILYCCIGYLSENPICWFHVVIRTKPWLYAPVRGYTNLNPTVKCIYAVIDWQTWFCVRYLLCGNVHFLIMFIAVLPLRYLDLVDVEHTV